MAIILIDSCVITDLADHEGGWFEWSVGTLDRLDQNHTLVINPIIYLCTAQPSYPGETLPIPSMTA